MIKWAALSICFGLLACTTVIKQPVDNLTWQSCQDNKFASWFDDDIPSDLECAVVSVPMSYTKGINNGKTVNIAMTRLSPKNPKGSLLFISGGPGQHSLSDAALLKDFEGSHGKSLLANFTIYGFAQRGVSPSSPEIVCDKRDDIDGKVFFDACLANTDREFLENVSSESVVHDLEQIRTQLGIDKIGMVGWSYGTKLVARYAELYGDHLSAGVLDGVVDSTENMFEMISGQERGYDKTMRAYFDDCANRTKCPFVSSQDYKAQFHHIIKHIGSKKLIDRKGREITSDRFLTLFYEQLMWSEYWGLADELVTSLNAGNTKLYDRLSYDYGDTLGLMEDMTVINCADSTMKVERDEYIRRMREIDELSDYDNYEPRDKDDYLDACYYWQDIALGTDILTTPKPKDGTPKLLFIAQTSDPATPYQNAVNMTKYFDGYLLTVQGDGHTLVFSDSDECVDEHALNYLLDPKQSGHGECGR